MHVVWKIKKIPAFNCCNEIDNRLKKFEEILSLLLEEIKKNACILQKIQNNYTKIKTIADFWKHMEGIQEDLNA